MKTSVLGILLVFSFSVFARPVTWVNTTYSNSDGRSWALSIFEEDLPPSSACDFERRSFRPHIAMSEMSCWLDKSGFDAKQFRLEEISIVPIGEGWKQCVYLVEMRNDSKGFGMKVGVDFEGKVHEPIQLPLNQAKLDAKKIERCTQ